MTQIIVVLSSEVISQLRPETLTLKPFLTIFNHIMRIYQRFPAHPKAGTLKKSLKGVDLRLLITGVLLPPKKTINQVQMESGTLTTVFQDLKWNWRIREVLSQIMIIIHHHPITTSITNLMGNRNNHIIFSRHGDSD